MKALVRSFTEARDYLADGRGQERRIAHETHVVRRGAGRIALRYHSTDVVTHFKDGRIRLDSGGYSTRTTKRRINQGLPGWIIVFQEDFNWYVQINNDQPIPFTDGMVIDAWTNVILSR